MAAAAASPVRLVIRVVPGSSRNAVGGTRGGRHGEALLVAVTARAVDGAATKAALDALATALGVRRGDVRLVAGATSRDKIVEVTSDVTAEELTARVADLQRG